MAKNSLNRENLRKMVLKIYPANRISLESLKELIIQGENNLALRTNILDNKTGFDEAIVIGHYAEIKEIFLKRLIWFSSLSAINIFLAVFFILFFIYRKEKYYLHFSLLSLSLGIWIIGYHGITFYIFDSKGLYILETYSCAILASIFLITFPHSFFKIRYNVASYIIFTVLALFLLANGIEYLLTGHLVFFNSHLYDSFILTGLIASLYSLCICFYAIKKGKSFAKNITAGIIILICSYGISIVVFLNIIKIYMPLSEGFFIMIVVFASHSLPASRKSIPTLKMPMQASSSSTE